MAFCYLLLLLLLLLSSILGALHQQGIHEEAALLATRHQGTHALSGNLTTCIGTIVGKGQG